MKFFKSIDDKIAELGFKKEREDQYGAEYQRDTEFGPHKVALLHKASGDHLLQSYDPRVLKVDGNYVCEGVGLTYKETRLFLKKMKALKLN